ncbi:MAG: type VI secretion system baseplate subunit TssG [Fibromonadales bacterium]|nr:type VI secretion system baseplate subunit TssG [Fibromonadales bacterium]
MGIKSSFFEWMLLWLLNKEESRELRILGSNSLKHPSGDIDSVKIAKSKVELVLNEMSLCGADSPLPDSLVRDIRTENDDSLILAGFLNVLQHYIAMFRFNAILERSNFFMQMLGNFKWQNRFALYSEKFSPEMLRCFFVKMFPDAEISVYCFEPMMVENPAPAILGNTDLNGAKLLGKTCTSLTNAMRVDVCGISLEQSIELKRNGGFLNVKFPFKIKVSFIVKSCGEICKLGSNKLSENFWLGCRNFEELKWEKWV